MSADEGVLVFHLADQFVNKDSSLSMLTTSNGIKKSKKKLLRKLTL